MVDLTTAVSAAFCNKLISGLLNKPFLVRSYETIPNIFHPQVQFYANQTYFQRGYSKRTTLFESLITPCKSEDDRRICRNMSLKLKICVVFFKFLTCLLLSRPFGNSFS